MKNFVIVCGWLWLSISCFNVYSASSNDDEINDILDDQVNVLNSIFGGDSTSVLLGRHIESEKLQQNKSETLQGTNKNSSEHKPVESKTPIEQKSVLKASSLEKQDIEIQKGDDSVTPQVIKKIPVVDDNHEGQLKPFGLTQRKKTALGSSQQTYRDNNVYDEKGLLKNPLGNDFDFFNAYSEEGEVAFSRNPFLLARNNRSFQVAYNEGIITNSQQLKMLAYNLFQEETLEDLLLAKQEIKSFLNQADSWIKEVIFDDSNWRLEDAIYGSTAFMFIYDSSVMRFLRKLDGSSESLNQIKDRFNIENGTTDASEKLYAEDSVLASGYYSILEFWKKHARTIIYLLLFLVLIKELTALVSRAFSSKSKAKSRRKKSRRSHKNMRTKQSTSTSPAPAYASVSVDGGVGADGTKESRRKHSSRRHYSSRRSRPKHSFIRKILDDMFVKSTHKK